MFAIVKVLLILQLSIAICRRSRTEDSEKSSQRDEDHSYLSRTDCDYHKSPRTRQPKQKGPGVSVSYTHWGRTACPAIPRTSTVYTGKAGGSRFSETGGGANYLCMPLTVEYASFEEGAQFSARGFLHGIEYETQDSPLESVHDHDVPCAVCLVRGSSATLMIPGRLSCPVGWRTEYTGYLVSSVARSSNMTTQQYYRTMFECLDRDPERFIGGAADGEGEVGVFVPVEANCNTLSCPPYIEEVEVPCAMCSKSL